MLIYSVIMLISAAIFTGISIPIYKGNTDLIHAYHQTKVTDKAAYGRAFGKALLVIAVVLLISGLIGLREDFAVPAVVVLVAGLCIGIGCLAAVQRKYNNGIF